MRSWSRPEVPRIPGRAPVPNLHDTMSSGRRDARPLATATLYVCGITPYDATHLGHAATYLAFDTLVRLWTDGDWPVQYAQNVTDVDDPLLERATATGVDWRELAADQIELFRTDMAWLGVIPPDRYVGVTEVIEPVAVAVQRLLDAGIAYRVERDVYFDSAAAAASSPWYLGRESGFDRATMLALSAERGGDPERPGKRDPLDPQLWRARREGEPWWPSVVGEGRPGWHIECSVIGETGLPLTVAGGGHDLVFPHHEFTAGHTAALTGHEHAAQYAHAGLVGFRGEKMSKSLGNLVLVSQLRASGADARAVRLALLAQHYRTDWEYTDALLTAATQRLELWHAKPTGGPGLVDDLRTALADDLDTPAALALVDAAPALTPTDRAAIHALLGIPLVE